ncbi:uncharacterized protein LOC131994148 [Stomoxys calcitrans]|uniref:uncharacterized protein LOC131994148 n=1 Tax=Stomoxys calcitrans TaxID=35570 RepID=UPI0027E27C8D|nr:uncharacterized protein LOC131994148 [Stomoxys calcitrans]
MDPEQTPVKTKAYFKQQWQQQETAQGSRGPGRSIPRRRRPLESRRRTSKSPRPQRLQLPPCYVRLERMVTKPVSRPVVAVRPIPRPAMAPGQTSGEAQPRLRPATPPAQRPLVEPLVRRPTAPIQDTIVLSSDSEGPPTQTRPYRLLPRRPPTPPLEVIQIVELSSDEEVLPNSLPRPFRFVPSNPPTPPPEVSPAQSSDESSAEELGVMGPAPAVSTSPRYVDSTASETEMPTSRRNPRLTATRVPTPPPARLSSAIVVPTPPLQRNYAYNCQERLPDEVQPALQRHIRVALAFHVPHRQYKKVVEICGRRYRIMVNRQGKVFVMPR